MSLAERRDVPHLGSVGGVRLVTITEAVGWWLLAPLEVDDEGVQSDRWRREPLAAWGLVADGDGEPYVCGLTAAGQDAVELADHPARYVHQSNFPACSCRWPSVLGADAFCARCAGEVPEGRR